MDDDLTIRTERDGTTAIVAAVGEIDISNVGDLRSAVTDAAEGCDRVRLDLTEVEFIDSTGLGGLLELRSTLRARDVTARDRGRRRPGPPGRGDHRRSAELLAH